MTSIAIVSDIHGNLEALHAVAADIQARGVSTVVNLGDSLSGPLLPRETARFLMKEGWLSISGNHERQILQLRPGHGGPSDIYAASQLSDAEFAWLRSLPASARLAEANVFLCHGTPRSDCEYFLETVHAGGVVLASPREIQERLHGEQADVVACGHTHVARSVRSADAQLLINPGSVGLPAYFDDHPVPHTVQSGSPDARYAIIRHADAQWSCELIAVPYDHREMAALAARRERPDWAQALLSGTLGS